MRIYQLALVLLHSCVGISASEKGSTDVSLRDQEQKPSRDYTTPLKASQAKYLGTVEDVYRDEIQVEVSSFLYSVYCISECMNNVKCIQKEAAQHFHSLILQLQLSRMRELRRLKGYLYWDADGKELLPKR